MISKSPLDFQIVESIGAYIDESSRVAGLLRAEASHIAEAVTVLAATVQKSGIIYSCGNGGSASEATHLTEELLARYRRDRPGIRAMHLIDGPTITCWANDYDFGGVFERQVRTLMTERDVLVALSTSGNSENILRALKHTAEAGITSILLSGNSGGEAKRYADISILVDSPDTAHIQEAHLIVIHCICQQLEDILFPEPYRNSSVS